MKSIKAQINALRKVRFGHWKGNERAYDDAIATLASIALKLSNPKQLRANILTAIESFPPEVATDTILDLLGVRVPHVPKSTITIKGKKHEVRIKRLTKTGVHYELGKKN